MVRISVLQWPIGDFKSKNELFDNLDHFFSSVSQYSVDFFLLPEYFNTPLIAQFKEENTLNALRELADYTDEIRDKLVQLAVDYHINIIGGNLPYCENEVLTNISFLCRRNGTWDAQKKIHITPAEKTEWGIEGANRITTFDTDVAKIGILIYYDVEFPELGRILAENGVQILFVPFSADVRSGYLRIRLCAQARAIENECYIAIAGSVGNTPDVKNMEQHYAQSAIFSPSDFAFLPDAVVAERTLNTAMTVVVDLDLDLLRELHDQGSVTNLKDRRTDLYEIIVK